MSWDVQQVHQLLQGSGNSLGLSVHAESDVLLHFGAFTCPGSFRSVTVSASVSFRSFGCLIVNLGLLLLVASVATRIAAVFALRGKGPLACCYPGNKYIITSDSGSF